MCRWNVCAAVWFAFFVDILQIRMLFNLLILSVFLFQYVKNNKESDNDWFRLESNKEGTRWFGKCWYIHELIKYEFEVEFDVSTWTLKF